MFNVCFRLESRPFLFRFYSGGAFEPKKKWFLTHMNPVSDFCIVMTLMAVQGACSHPCQMHESGGRSGPIFTAILLRNLRAHAQFPVDKTQGEQGEEHRP
jgi:hypothetical protein